MYHSTSKRIKHPGHIFILAVTALVNACEQPAKQYDYSILAFGTLIDISLYDVNKEQAQTAFEQLQKDFDKYHQDWSSWTDGELAQVNVKLEKQTPAPLPDHLVSLINDSMVLSQQSNDYYNPTIGKLINLWQFHKYQESDIRPPDSDQIKKLVAENPKLTDLYFNKTNQLLTKNPAVSLNFGAFAKGYAIQLSIKQLQKLNIKNAIINAGGDLSVIGRHGDRAWNIGIRHPREDNVLASLAVNNDESVFTSGDYERYYYYQGKRYHHILNPRTGYPTDDAQSVTVIHQDAGRADAAATALFVAGSNDWQSVAKNMGIKLAMLVDAKGDIHVTPAMNKRLKFINKSPASRIILSQQL